MTADATSGRGTGAAALALAAVAGLTAVAVTAATRRSRSPDLGTIENTHEPVVARSMTIDRVTPDEVVARFRDPHTLARIAGRAATVEVLDDGRTRWTGPSGLGTWTMSAHADGESHRWIADSEGAPLQDLTLRVCPAQANRGTVATLVARVDPPGGVIGRWAAEAMGDLLPAAFVTGALYYLKALMVTGEIPTTERQPAARRDPR